VLPGYIMNVLVLYQCVAPKYGPSQVFPALVISPNSGSSSIVTIVSCKSRKEEECLCPGRRPVTVVVPFRGYMTVVAGADVMSSNIPYHLGREMIDVTWRWCQSPVARVLGRG
jgi:hypothetical protein